MRLNSQDERAILSGLIILKNLIKVYEDEIDAERKPLY
jgi:hypothetical protein